MLAANSGGFLAGGPGGMSIQLVDACAADAAKRKEKKRRAKTFPDKLHQAMTEYAVTEDAVAWLPDGKSFVIVNPDLFVATVLAPIFKQCKYASFVRKLHRWGFVRLTSGTGTDCFHHPLFQKGRKDLASKIICTPRDKDSLKGSPYGKPPSLAGVERFIRAKAAAVAAAAKMAAAAAAAEGKDTASGKAPASAKQLEAAAAASAGSDESDDDDDDDEEPLPAESEAMISMMGHQTEAT